MRIVFMGSAAFSCASLEAIVAGGSDRVVAVITQPDRPKGRKLEVCSCPVKDRAVRLGLSVLTPEKVNAPESVKAIEALAPDLIAVVAYGQMLGPGILRMPPYGCINIHASLLPMYRGAAPIQWAIALGEPATGVTSMFMDERMDAGDIILRRAVAIMEEDTGGSMRDKLAKEGASLLSETLELTRGGNVPRTPQSDSEATFAPKLGKKDGRIDWALPAEAVHNRVRGFNPWPLCWCAWRSRPGPARGGETPACDRETLRIFRTRIEDADGNPGEVIDVSGDGPLVAAGEGSVRLLELQPAGKRVMRGAEFLRGYQMRVGEKIG